MGSRREVRGAGTARAFREALGVGWFDACRRNTSVVAFS